MAHDLPAAMAVKDHHGDILEANGDAVHMPAALMYHPNWGKPTDRASNVAHMVRKRVQVLYGRARNIVQFPYQLGREIMRGVRMGLDICQTAQRTDPTAVMAE